MSLEKGLLDWEGLRRVKTLCKTPNPTHCKKKLPGSYQLREETLGGLFIFFIFLEKLKVGSFGERKHSCEQEDDGWGSSEPVVCWSRVWPAAAAQPAVGCFCSAPLLCLGMVPKSLCLGTRFPQRLGLAALGAARRSCMFLAFLLLCRAFPCMAEPESCSQPGGTDDTHRCKSVLAAREAGEDDFLNSFHLML